MSPLVLDFIKTALAPALAVGIVFLLVGGLSDPLRARIQSVVWALAFTVGAYFLVGRLSFPPTDVNEAFSCGALLLAGFVLISPKGVDVRYLTRAIFVVALGALALWPIRASLHGYAHYRNLAAFFFLALGTWSIVERASSQLQTLTMIVLPIISATALSVFLMFKGSASMSQLVSVLCALLGAVAFLALIKPKRVSMAAVLPFISVFIILFMASGHFYLDINPWHMIYLCLPFLLIWFRGYIPFVPRRPIPEAIILGAASAAPLGYFLYTVYQQVGPLD